MQINQFNNTISSYMRIHQFNNTLNSYMQINQFNNTISSYLKTSDFNLTKSSLVNTTTVQDILERKRFFKPITMRCGGGSIRILPEDNNIGEASIQYYRNSDASYPVLGDFWTVGLDVSSGYGLTPNRSFSF